MKKMQLFKLVNSKEIALVNLSVSEMNDSGEMQAWKISMESNDSLEKNTVTWDDLEAGALLMSWSDLPNELSIKFKEIIDKITIPTTMREVGKTLKI